MAIRYSRQQFLDRLLGEIERGKPLVMTGAGNGIAAKFIELGGVDILGVYNTGYFRMQGYGSLAGMLPMADANDMVYQIGKREVLPQVKETPVIAGLNGVDVLRDMRLFLEDIHHIAMTLNLKSQAFRRLTRAGVLRFLAVYPDYDGLSPLSRKAVSSGSAISLSGTGQLRFFIRLSFLREVKRYPLAFQIDSVLLTNRLDELWKLYFQLFVELHHSFRLSGLHFGVLNLRSVFQKLRSLFIG